MNIVNGETTTELNSYAGAKRENIVIPNNITKITGNNFYYYESNMPSFYIKGSLTIGDGIKEIPATAFYVQNITKLILGSNVETIDYGAFYSNSSLSEIVFNNKLKTIKRGAFQSCTALTSLNFPDSLETIEGANNSSHFKTYKKDPYNYPNTLGYWLSYGYDGFGAFARCTGLTSVSFGSGIKNVGVSAFHGDSKLATINTDRIAGLATFDDFAFYGTKITKFTVPSSVKVIEDRVLAGISTLNEIYIKGKAELEEFDHLGIEWNGVCNNIKFEVESCFTQSGGKITSYNNSCSKNAKIPDTIDNVKIKGIASGAFNGSNLVSVYIPSAIKTIDAGAFTNSNIEYIMAEGKTNSSDFTTADSNWNNGIHVIYSKNQLTCLKIDDNNIIQGYYFGAPNNICNREIDLPNTIKGATENALQGGVIKSIKVADGARFTTMGEGWSGSASYVQFLGDSYDYNCFTLDGSTITKYRNFCKPTVDLSTNNGMVQGVKITKIGANAFKETGITSFKFTDDITEVGDNAFSGNYELSQVTFVNAVNNDSSNLFKVGNEAFYNCDLVSVNLPGSLKIVGDRAFDDNIRLSSIIVLNKTSLNEFESLGERWNGDCTKITFQRNR